MRRAPRPVAIVLAASTVTLSLLFLTGCEGDEASRADRTVNRKIESAYTTDKPIDALKEAADNDKASGASRARAKAMLADAELIAANDQMRQIEQHENRIASLVWELNQLGQSANASARLIETYRSYDPAIVRQSADAHIAEVKGESLDLKKQLDNASIPGLSAVAKNVSTLQEQINKQKAELDQLTSQRNQLVQQADESAHASESAKGREAVDAFTKASNLRKQAAVLSNQIDTANSMLARLNADLATQQGQQQVLAALVTEYQAGADATDKGFKAVSSQEEAHQRLIKEIYGTAGGAPSTSPAATPATIQTRASELAADVSESDQLRKQAEDSLKSAVQHYADAQQAAEDLRRKIDEKMGSAPADAPERTAWEDMKKLVNPSSYQLQKSIALQTLGSLYAANAQSLSARVRLANDLTKALQPAGLKLPDSLNVKDGAAQLKELSENMNKTYTDAADLEDNVIAAPLATESQKAAARVGKIITSYSWSNALASTGNAAEAKKRLAEATQQVKDAVADNVTLPALPPEIAPAPKLAAAPTSAPAATPAPAPAHAPAAAAPTPAPAPAPAAAP